MNERARAGDKVTIVYTEGGMLLTKKHYADWRAVQDFFDDYVTSLGPRAGEDLMRYLDVLYPVDPPFPRGAVLDFLESDEIDLWWEPAMEAVRRFEDAAIKWAGTGNGKPLVDAAVTALLDGLDTPSLRVLAGAPARFADEEANDIAANVFDELGLFVPEKHSEDAYVALARLKAQRYLINGGSARTLASELWNLYLSSNYREELADFSGLDDWFAMLDEGIVESDLATVEDAVAESARRLIDGEPSRGSRLGSAFMDGIEVDQTSWSSKVKTAIRQLGESWRR